MLRFGAFSIVVVQMPVDVQVPLAAPAKEPSEEPTVIASVIWASLCDNLSARN